MEKIGWIVTSKPYGINTNVLQKPYK
jgi:hypothetical protein